MSATLLDGKALSSKLLSELQIEVSAIKAKFGKIPRFVNITVGEDPSAASYTRSQVRAAEAVGVEYQFARLSHNVSQKELIDQIMLLNHDPDVHGIMLHKPLPQGVDFQTVANCIASHKDIEGITEVNLGKLILGTAVIVPCTPASVMALIASSGVDIAGKEAVVVGRSEIVGKPVALLLLQKNATVRICHSGTSRAGKLEEHVRAADVLVVAMGHANFIKGEWVKNGATVIDVGINSVDGKLVGDVAFAAAAQRAGYITPVPGGVGPVTSVMLMKNGIAAFKQQAGL